MKQDDDYTYMYKHMYDVAFCVNVCMRESMYI